MYQESKISGGMAVVLIAAVFLLIFAPWIFFPRELFREEALYAVEAAELASPVVTAHQVVVRNAHPLFPALTALLHRGAGLSMEISLRLISALFLLAGGVLVYFAAATGNGRRAGWVAAAMYCSTILVMESVMESSPGSLNAFLLLAAQMFFFYFGLRQGRWNLAWIGAGALLAVGYYSGGLTVLLYFGAPMLFFRRPLAGRAKFRHWGFAAGAAIVAATVVGHLVLYRNAAVSTAWWDGFSFIRYGKEFLLFWLLMPLRLMPWTLIAWWPFCVALQALDRKPLFSKYLRTLFLVTAALLWLSPKLNGQEIFYLPGTLAILTGIYYEPGSRRYGERLRKLTGLSCYFGLVVVVLLLCGAWASKELLANFVSTGNSLGFRQAPHFHAVWGVALAAVLGISALLYRIRQRAPLWVVLLGVSALLGVFSSTILLRYHAQDRRKIELGHLIRDTLRRDRLNRGGDPETPVKLYKTNIADLYGALYYSGAQIHKLNSDIELRDAGTAREVYLINTEFPENPRWHWTNILTHNYLDRALMVWRGERNRPGH